MSREPTLPDLPSGFEGDLLTDADTRSDFASASGPFAFTPAAVAVPRSGRDAALLAAWASRNGVPLIPRGGGTGMPGGNVGPGVVVEMTAAFDTVGPVDASRRTVRVGPGATAARVDEAARAKGLLLPALPSSADRCRIGGMVANNAAGARSFRHGSIRERVRSVEVALCDGRLLRLEADGELPEPFDRLHRSLRRRWPSLVGAWPDVRKNSSGYALDRFVPGGDPVQLLVGSEGTLGLVTEVELELEPIPEERGLAVLGVDDPAGLIRTIRAAGELGASACEFLGRRFLELTRMPERPGFGRLADGAYALVLVEFAGVGRRVRSDLERIRAVAEGLGVRTRTARRAGEREELWGLRHAASPAIARAAEEGRVSMQFIEDSVVPPGRLPDYLRGLDAILRSADTDAVVFGHAGDGNVHVNPLIDVERDDWRERVATILSRTAGLVARLGGTLSGEHGDGRVRAPYLETIWGPEVTAAFREVKDVLDPAGVLNPGVILPEPGQDPLAGMWRSDRGR